MLTIIYAFFDNDYKIFKKKLRVNFLKAMNKKMIEIILKLIFKQFHLELSQNILHVILYAYKS